LDEKNQRTWKVRCSSLFQKGTTPSFVMDLAKRSIGAELSSVYLQVKTVKIATPKLFEVNAFR
uniref:MSP domain-containing protein n=1 Tax=Angiostrongylus cantonensis TaxID=6313 RepID=A0A0K0D422_ANGCA